jgi:endoglucanase
MAIAARVYKPYDASFADAALKAAERAWTWLDQHPNVLFRNPPPVATGGYGDGNCADERLWAAAELARTTRRDPYRRYFLENYEGYRKSIRPDGPPSWPNVAALALWTHALGEPADAPAAVAIRQDSLAAADRIVERSRSNGYRISLTARDYIWGSNSVVANYGMQLLVANAFRPDPRYVDSALDNLHYLLGRNTFSTSFVTQVGANAFVHPHHRPSGADANPLPWPGLLSGGPNRSPQDPAMKKLAAGLPPARMWLDDQESYASNELAINWNAPLVFLLAAGLPAR